MPSKEEWENMSETVLSIMKQMAIMLEKLEGLQSLQEHFPENMTIKLAAKYMGCNISKIKSMIYKQKLLKPFQIDFTTTVYVSKKDLDGLRFRMEAIKNRKDCS